MPPSGTPADERGRPPPTVRGRRRIPERRSTDGPGRRDGNGATTAAGLRRPPEPGPPSLPTRLDASAGAGPTPPGRPRPPDARRGDPEADRATSPDPAPPTDIPRPTTLADPGLTPRRPPRAASGAPEDGLTRDPPFIPTPPRQRRSRPVDAVRRPGSPGDDLPCRPARRPTRRRRRVARHPAPRVRPGIRASGAAAPAPPEEAPPARRPRPPHPPGHRLGRLRDDHGDRLRPPRPREPGRVQDGPELHPARHQQQARSASSPARTTASSSRAPTSRHR